MRTEPAIDREALARAIREEYGLAADRLSFIPAGLYAFCYRVESGVERHFLKVWPKPLPTYVSTEATRTMLALTALMHERRAFADFSYPLPTRSGLHSWMFGDRLAALFPFLEGRTPEPSARFAGAFGRRIAELHAATTAMGDCLPAREALGVPFGDTLRRNLAGLDAAPDRPGRIRVRELLLPIRDDLLGLLDAVMAMRETVRAIAEPFVLCHRDTGWHNLLEGDHGRLFFLDWDDVAMAPPEHDLFAGRGPWFRETIAGYLAAGGTRGLHLNHFRFVHLRRILDDVSYDLNAIATSETGAEDAHAIEIVERYVLPEWQRREETIAAIAAALRAEGL